jgi:membrane peptidoglycan carboxypeptidase
LVGVGLAFFTLLGASIIALAFGYASVTADLPSLQLLPALLDSPTGLLLQPTRLYDRTGAHLLASLSPQAGPREYVYLNPALPDHLPDVAYKPVIALADSDFWNHDGYSLSGLSNPEIHPTLAQKLAADLLLWDEPPSLRRAIRERILAWQITGAYGREKVLEWYLNSANYGNFAYGLDSAARLYFGRPANRLTLAEFTLLAAVSQSPALNPFDAQQAAIENQQKALELFERQSIFSPEELNLARFQPLIFAEKPRSPVFAPAFIQIALGQLDSAVNRARIERGGMLVVTTLDFDVQTRAACAVQAQLARLGGLPDPAECSSLSQLPSLPPGITAREPAASAVVLDPRYGQILAAVGETRQGQESAFLTGRRAGTLLTPFIYLTGFTRGLSPASLMWDIPPADSVNFNPEAYKGPVRLRIAMANDYLIPAENVLGQMSQTGVLQTMRSFGLEVSPAADGLLASPTPFSPLVMAQAYGTFAAQGILTGQEFSAGQVRPAAILRVQSLDGVTLLDWSAPKSAQVASPQLAYLVNDILSDESARWPSQGRPNPFEIGRPVAAKTGQVPGGSETWAAGYTPYRVVAAWLDLGVERPSTLPAAGLWSALMQSASAAQPPDSFPMPPGISTLTVCDPSGLLPTDECPNTAREIFLDGNQPVQADTLYRAYYINRETKLLATVFTPSRLVERRIYMVVPPEAQAWAATRQDSPPTVYDTIQPPHVDPAAHLTSPGMFASLKGKVTITGTAASDDFSFYRLQYGLGLNPEQWVLIGTDTQTPVIESTLAEWDTSSLNGLYALQLIVVTRDGLLKTSTVQVSVDNTPPQIQLDFPETGAVLKLSEHPQVIFAPQVSDNLSLASVEISIDNRLLTSSESQPAPAVWASKRGNHTLRILARDQAGNESQFEVVFTVGD